MVGQTYICSFIAEIKKIGTFAREIKQNLSKSRNEVEDKLICCLHKMKSDVVKCWGKK